MLDILEMNDGEITNKELEGIIGDNYNKGGLLDLSTADFLELAYHTSSFGYTIAEIDYMMTQERID